MGVFRALFEARVVRLELHQSRLAPAPQARASNGSGAAPISRRGPGSYNQNAQETLAITIIITTVLSKYIAQKTIEHILCL